MKRIVLASRSMRRRNLMQYITYNFIVKPSDVDETIIPGQGSIEEQALKIAKNKVYQIFDKYNNDIVIAAVTIVIVDGVMLGKPKNDEDAKRMLRLLNGKEHLVITAMFLKDNQQEKDFVCHTNVRFEKMTEDEIEYYVNTGEGMEKAGAYAIQGMGSRYIPSIEGNFYNVLGLPIYELYHVLKEFEN